jgi:hypothetical protein
MKATILRITVVQFEPFKILRNEPVCKVVEDVEAFRRKVAEDYSSKSKISVDLTIKE